MTAVDHVDHVACSDVLAVEVARGERERTLLAQHLMAALMRLSTLEDRVLDLELRERVLFDVRSAPLWRAIDADRERMAVIEKRVEKVMEWCMRGYAPKPRVLASVPPPSAVKPRTEPDLRDRPASLASREALRAKLDQVMGVA